ncbi:MAG: phosphoribosylanthranilate isomerase [Alphaproteobacteria bacterium]|nr:phosphoribosylanthranilate isomerase [Alphaproteobacteria bacterium]
MAVKVKICGINAADALGAAVDSGADFVGFVFYPPSPRAVTPEQAHDLASRVPASVRKVGLFVDPDDALLERTLAVVALDLIQLHGRETPERVAQIRARFGKPVMKAIKVAAAADLDRAAAFEAAADWLLFDGVPPKDMKNALPGGNAALFDWSLLKGRSFARPWMLSGGLDPANIAEAIRTTEARCVDVSSGVESRPGVKDPARIRAFIRAARGIGKEDEPRRHEGTKKEGRGKKKES